MDWESKGINGKVNDGKYLSYLRFADDMVLFRISDYEDVNAHQHVKGAKRSIASRVTSDELR